MVETGGSILIALSLVVMLLSLLPLCILFVRKVAIPGILNVLTILCVVIFLERLLLTFIQPGSAFLRTGFNLAAFTLSFYLFKQMMISPRGKELMNMFLVSFLSVVITIYSLKGITAFTITIHLTEAAIIIMMSVITLLQLIRNRHIVLIHEPGFWITGGLLCYYGMVILMELITGYNENLSQQIQHEKHIVLLVTNMIRLGLFSVATAVAGKGSRQ